MSAIWSDWLSLRVEFWLVGLFGIRGLRGDLLNLLSLFDLLDSLLQLLSDMLTPSIIQRVMDRV